MSSQDSPEVDALWEDTAWKLSILAAIRQEKGQLKEEEKKVIAERDSTDIGQMALILTMKRKKSEKAESQLRKEIEENAILLYEKIGSKKPLESVEIQGRRSVKYNQNELFEWCLKNALMFLTIDVDRIKKAALDGLLPEDAPVEVVTEPSLVIRSDLSCYESDDTMDEASKRIESA